MKQIFSIIALLIGIIFSAGAQAYINVKSTVPEQETSWFILYVNEEPQDAFAYDEMEAEDLLPGKYELRLAFNSDTIADVYETVKLERGDSLYFEVVDMKEFKQEARKAGRGFGRLFDKDRDVRTKDGYVEIYQLRELETEK